MGAGEAIVKLAAMVDAEVVVKSRDDVAGDSRAVGWESTGGVAGSVDTNLPKDEWRTDIRDISEPPGPSRRRRTDKPLPGKWANCSREIRKDRGLTFRRGGGLDYASNGVRRAPVRFLRRF